MMIQKIEEHKYIKLIKFAIDNPRFSPQQAAGVSNIGIDEFNLIWKSIFHTTPNLEKTPFPSQPYDWILKPEAFFSYMSFLEYKDSIKTAKRAHWLAISALVVSSILALASFVTSLISLRV